VESGLVKLKSGFTIAVEVQIRSEAHANMMQGKSKGSRVNAAPNAPDS
jgi:hypothetical protein